MKGINSLSHSKWRYRKNNKETVWTKRSRDNRGTSVSRLYTHANLYTTKFEYSTIYGLLERKINLMIFDRNANLKCKYGNRHFGCRGIM